MSQAPNKSIEEKTNLPSTGINYEADAGAGTEGADKDSYAIPFLVLLQPMSPPVADGSVPGARAGMLLNSITNEALDAAIIIPCAFQRRWIRWAPRDSGGGFKGEFSTAEIQTLRASGQVKDLDGRFYFPLEDGSINEKKCDHLADTRNHYVLVMRTAEEELAAPMVLSLTSTNIKHSKNFLSRIDSIKKQRADGSPYTPASFSHMYRLGSVKKTNEKGTWWMVDISPVGEVKNAGLYGLAKAFHDNVVSGKVQVAQDSVRSEGGGAASDAEGF